MPPQSGCPSFFKEEDKLYYSATTLLQRAEAATGAADRDDLAHQAVALMSKVFFFLCVGGCNVCVYMCFNTV